MPKKKDQEGEQASDKEEEDAKQDHVDHDDHECDGSDCCVYCKQVFGEADRETRMQKCVAVWTE